MQIAIAGAKIFGKAFAAAGKQAIQSASFRLSILPMSTHNGIVTLTDVLLVAQMRSTGHQARWAVTPPGSGTRRLGR